jgi:transposase
VGRDPPDAVRGGLSIKEIARRMGRDRNTIRRALRSEEPPRYRRAERPSKLGPFREEIHRLLREPSNRKAAVTSGLAA